MSDDLTARGSVDPQLHTKPTGQPDLGDRDPAELVEEHVKDNYRELNKAGRPYAALADDAERMGDHILAEYLRRQTDTEEFHAAKRENDAEAERAGAAAKRAEGQPDKPEQRTAPAGKRQNA